ncbi:hypothetical protein GOP47_0008565 [Adiantum capillus-veneris]|uniref:Isochorismatase-like domain-containing protein n=1 Tax=Adiantum capillus-veneris TaxID=13818 RepID=A0A9D4UYL1_ADICA|nr:hypothetical protein GOP47_0008565 [Adiantum capillus-veneris]
MLLGSPRPERSGREGDQRAWGFLLGEGEGWNQLTKWTQCAQAVPFAREKGALIVWVVREHHLSGRDVELFRMGIQNLIFAGIQTPNCIRQAVFKFDAVAYDYPSIVVLSDATLPKSRKFMRPIYTTCAW